MTLIGPNSTAGTYTFDFWLNSTQSGGGPRLLYDGTGPRFFVFWWRNIAGGSYGFFGDDGGGYRELGLTPNDGVWHLLSITFNGTSGEAIGYIDGQRTGNSSYVARNLAGTQVLFVDNTANVCCFYDGWADEIRISDIVRYTGNFTPPTSEYALDGNILALWHMNEGTGQTIADASGNGNTGTLGSTGGTDAGDPTWIGAEEPASHEGEDWDSPESPINELTNFTITLSNRTGTGYAGEPWWFTIGGAGSDDAWWNIYDENDLRWLYAVNQTYMASYPHIGLDSGLHTLYAYSNDTDGTEFLDTLALTVRDYDPIAYAALSLGIIAFVGVFGFIYRRKRR